MGSFDFIRFAHCAQDDKKESCDPLCAFGVGLLYTKVTLGGDYE